jgi:hypothetical protein
VCFDDFERLSPSIKLEEVLGLIAELKEQNLNSKTKCNTVATVAVLS